MKTSSAILIVLGLASALSFAQVPGLMSYQGKVVDSTGTGLGTGTPINRKIIFRLFDAGTGGNRLWSEEQTVTLSNGDFSVILGQGASASYNGSPETPRPSLLTVFGGTDRYLEIVVDNGDGTFNATDTPITPRQRLVSTAFAVRAAIADSVASGTDLNLRDSNHGLGWYGSGRPFNGVNIDGPVLYGYSGGVLGSVNGAVQTIALRWTNTGNIGIGTATPSEKLDVAGNAKISGNLVVGGSGTFGGGVAAPTNDSGGSGMRLNLYPGNATATPFGFGIDASTLFSVVPSTASHRWYGGTTERMALNGSNGNLNVSGDIVSGSYSNTDRFIHVRTQGGNVARSGINFHHHDGTYGWSVFSDERTVSGYGFHIDSIYAGSVNTRLFIDTSGNVGIGTTSPTSILDVAGAVKSSGNISAASFSTSGNISAASLTSSGGLSFGGFGANADEGGSSGDFISFDTTGFSEDFIGYASNTFYMKDSPGGGDSTEPNLVVGGKVSAKGKTAAVGEEELRIIRGTVKGNAGTASVVLGSGFTTKKATINGSVNHETYEVVFNSPFSGVPSITAGYIKADTNYDNGRLFVTIYEPSAAGFKFRVMGDGGDYFNNENISFIAVGPR